MVSLVELYSGLRRWSTGGLDLWPAVDRACARGLSAEKRIPALMWVAYCGSALTAYFQSFIYGVRCALGESHSLS